MTAPFGTLRAAFEATGSPFWAMRVIREQGFDARHGFRLELTQSGDRGSRAAQATLAALAAGDTDLIDADWIAIARGHLAPVFPYGRIMGGAVAAEGSGIEDLSDLPGRRVGVIRVIDKNWIVARAAFRKRYGSGLHEQVTVKEALSKTTLAQWLEAGEVDAAVLPWHLVPRFTVRGFRQIFDVLDLTEELGAGAVPTTFFAVKPDFAASKRAALAAFAAAYADAVKLMRANESVWRAAAAQPGDGSEMLAALRASWLRRIAFEWEPQDGARLESLFELLKESAGEEALGLSHMPRGLFGLERNSRPDAW